MTFGKLETTPPFGTVDDSSQPPAEWRCWEIEGERGTYEEEMTNATLLHGRQMWMILKGYHFAECLCLRGEWGEYPEKCKSLTEGNNRPFPELTTTTNPDGSETRSFERITKCTPKFDCGELSWVEVPGYDDMLTRRCGDYASCCFLGRKLVDTDMFADPEPCWDGDPSRSGSIINALWNYSGNCANYINSWLSANPPNEDCDMKIDCTENPPVGTENPQVKCDKYTDKI